MNKANNNIGFMLVGIATEQFAMFENNHVPNKNIELSTSFQFKVDTVNKHIGVYVELEFMQASSPIIKLETSCHFKLETSSWDSLIEGENIVLPKDFGVHLLTLVIGTSRGILYAKTEHSVFSKYMVPLLDVFEMLEGDIVISLK